MKIDVGSVIFLIDPKSRSIIPARINEQVVTKKIEGETITHNIVLPNDKITQLESLDAAFFSTLDEVRDYLLAQAESLINVSISDAQSVAEEKFGLSHNPFDSMSDPPQLKNDSTKMQVTLPDGNVANVNVKIPSEFLDENTGN